MENVRRVHSRGSCLAALAIILTVLQPCRGLVISELMYHPADAGETLEFIELYNNQPTSEDLGGSAFTSGVQYTFPSGVLLAPKKYLVVARDPNALQAAYGSITGVYGPYAGRLDNAGERIELTNDSNGIVLSVRYRSESPWPVAPDGTGHSLILARMVGDPDEGSSYASGTLIGGTPGQADESQVIPETEQQVLVDIGFRGRYFKGSKEPSPAADGKATTAWTQIDFDDDPSTTGWLDGLTGYGYSSDQAELQHVRTQLTDMNGGYISVYARLRFTLTAAQIASFDKLLAEVHYDDAYVLYLNGTRVADSGGISGTPPAFSQAAGTASDYSAAGVDLTGQLNLLKAGTNVLAIQAHNSSLSGSSDFICSPVLRATLQTTSLPAAAAQPILINELQTASGAGRIELYNPGPLPVDVNNLYLGNDPQNLLACALPPGVNLMPGQFRTVAEDYSGDGFRFSLDPAGGTVYVTAATSDGKPVRVLDAVRYGAMEPNQTFGRYPNGADTFDFLTAPTFGSSNARPVIGPVVINEIMYHHPMQDDSYEFIELHNRSTTDVSLNGWVLSGGIEYAFGPEAQLPAGGYIIVAKAPHFLSHEYPDLLIGSNLFGPYTGTLGDSTDRIRLSRPITQTDPQSGRLRTDLVLTDDVTYYDSGFWPTWADGDGVSLELRDPNSDNNVAAAWAASDEQSKTEWQAFSMTINASDTRYTHDAVSVFDMIMLTRGEVLLDDLELVINGRNVLTNGDFENGETGWRILGNHVQSFVTSSESHSGQRCLHLIATGRGDPGANRINQSFTSATAGTVTFRGYARWLRGSRFLLLRASRAQSPVQPPRPAWAFELTAPLNLGTPGRPNTALTAGRGPDILDVKHSPVLPAANEPILVTARVQSSDALSFVTLKYKTEGDAAFANIDMVDDGTGADRVAGDGIYSATIPGAAAGAMRSFHILASDETDFVRFPPDNTSSSKALVPDCLVRVGDTTVVSSFDKYRVWLSIAGVSAFTSRSNYSNELVPCVFVCNDSEVFYNAQIRFRGSPFLRPGTGWKPSDRHAFRIEFGGDQAFRGQKEVNLDNTEGSGRGPLQERASFWFLRQLGAPYPRQEFVRPIINGNAHTNYEDVQVLNGDFIERWFPDDSDGELHKVDDYFEYDVAGTTHSYLQEGLKYDAQHPLLNETHRWGFDKRAHPESDNWDHVFNLVVQLNASSTNGAAYETAIESVLHPAQYARAVAVQHAVGNWDSYGYRRGKNSYFYLAANEGKWYLLPWDIDFTLGSGDNTTRNIFEIDSGQFPEVYKFISYPKYRQLYLQTLADMVNGPWKTSYGTTEPPTAFDRFLDDAANAMIADGLGSDRQDGIKQFVKARRTYLLTVIPVSMIK